MNNFIVQIRDNIDHNLWRGVVEWAPCAKRKVTGVDKPTPVGAVRLRHLKWTVYPTAAATFDDIETAKFVANALRLTYGKESVKITSLKFEDVEG